MARSKDEQRGYQRGYLRAQRNEWPHVEGVPDARYRALAVAAKELSDRVDSWMAYFDDRDTDAGMLGIDKARDVLLDEILRARSEAVESIVPAPDPEARREKEER